MEANYEASKGKFRIIQNFFYFLDVKDHSYIFILWERLNSIV
jgi:hypothetical protein